MIEQRVCLKTLSSGIRLLNRWDYMEMSNKSLENDPYYVYDIKKSVRIGA